MWVVSNLFPRPDEPQRATFNAQQFRHLANRVPVVVIVPVEFRHYRREFAAVTEYAGLPVRYVPFYYIPGALRFSHGWTLYASLRLDLLRRPLPAPIHILGSFAYPDGFAAARLAAARRVPWSLKVHGNDINVMARAADRRGRQLRRLLATAPDIVAVSRALKSTLTEIGVPDKRVRVVYNGINHDRFHPTDRRAARAALGLAPDGQHVLFVGNLKPSKGCVRLLDALADQFAAHPGLELHFIGSGPAAAELEARGPGQGLAVRLHGSVDHAKLALWYNAASVVALPSDAEGVPNVLLEAMACGTPVVATRVGGIAEVVAANAGFVVEPGDTAALTEKLLTALTENWDHATIAAHMRQFDWQSSADGLLPKLTDPTRVGAAEDAGKGEDLAP